MSDEVRGRFGVVTPEAVAYLRSILDAFFRAPSGEWAEGKLDHVLETECSRYGVEVRQIALDHVPSAVVDPIEDAR